MKNANYDNIIQLLREYRKKEYISSEKIGRILGLSKRTVLSYLDRLRAEAQGNGFQLIAKQGAGCKLVVEDPAAFDAWLRAMAQDDEPSEVEKRRMMIFWELLSSSNYVNIYDLADEFFVSPSLIRKDIKSLQSLVDRYHLTLRHSHSRGYIIVGEEQDIRTAIAQECSGWLDLLTEGGGGRHRTQVLEELSASIEKHLTAHNISISQPSINSLCIYILIAINRVETCNPIRIPELQGVESSSPEYLAVTRIGEDIGQIFGVALPEEEIRYIVLHIKGKTAPPEEGNRIPPEENWEAIEFYGLFLRSIYKQSGIDLFDDDNLKWNLISHISLFLDRMKKDQQAVHSNLSSVKDEFPYANELTILGLRPIIEKYGKRITEEETLYFTIHLALSLETKDTVKGYNLAVLLDDSMTVFKLISHKLKQALKDRINIIQLFFYSEAKEEELSKFDIIVNASGKKLWFDQPVVSTEAVLSSTDISLIEMLMDRLDERSSVHEIFRKDLYYALEAGTKEELLETVIRDVSGKLGFSAQDFYRSVTEREKFGSTAYSRHIAVPHPLESEKYPHFVAICRLDKPISWDDKNVELVFLANCTQKTIQILFKLLSKVILSNDKMYLLQKTASYEEFIDELCK